jgi:beta-xylosidase
VNPVWPGYLADPFVWTDGHEYYAIGTGRAEAAGDTDAGARVFPLLRSPDLLSWTSAGHALERPAAALGTTFWAPEVVRSDATWFLYYSVGFEDRYHHLRVARSAAPLGPYVDCGALTDPQRVPFAIDPHPFRDVDGRWYLFHARDFLDDVDDRGRSVRPGTALVVHGLTGMTRLDDEGRTVARARFDWQRFGADRAMYGGRYDWHTLEGPFVVREAGRYWCLYSGGCWQTDTYGVDYVVADSVLGPWSDSGAERGPRLLRTVPGRVLGPGHCSVVGDADGGPRWLAYHAWNANQDARRLCIDPVTFTRAGPVSRGPTWTPQPVPTLRGRAG